MLPDQGTLTQIMILTNVLDGVRTPSQIAKNVGITVQGVQYHMKILKGKKLLTEDGNVSKLGYVFLETGLSSMRDFVSQNLSRLDEFSTWEVIADEDLRDGETANVYMDQGYLHAALRSGQVKGRVKKGSRKGGTALVSIMEGMINVHFGEIKIVVIPDFDEMQEEKIKNKLVTILDENSMLLAVVGELAWSLCTGIGKRPSIEFASLTAAFEAAVRGMSTVLCVSERRFRYLLYDLKVLEGRYSEVKTEIVYLKE